MNKVITINLNGNAYQLDEGGYEALRLYLEQAEARLADNPDRTEIIKDLEQSIAERCLRYLGRAKNVVSTAEIEQILREVGPVEGSQSGSAAAEPPGSTRSTAPGAPSTAAGAGATTRLYQIREGAMISGVCNGIAAYLSIDPTIVRVVFVILGLPMTPLFHGVGIPLYLLLMFLIPYAKTSEELAAAQGTHAGLPYRVQRVVEKIKGKMFGKPVKTAI